MTRFRVIDLETTGLAPPAEIIEIGRTDVVATNLGVTVEAPLSMLYRPLNGIPPETMAVHHLTEADFDPNTSVCTPQCLRAALYTGPSVDVFVAHNCAFERQFITAAATGDTPWICTYKVALHLWPDAPKHGNQVLRLLARPDARPGACDATTPRGSGCLGNRASPGRVDHARDRRAVDCLDPCAKTHAGDYLRKASRHCLARVATRLSAMDVWSAGYGCRCAMVCQSGTGASKELSQVADIKASSRA